MVVDMVRTINRVGKWSLNRAIGRRRPLIGVFSLTHYCNYFCPMCPFGDSDKQGQLKLASKNDLTTSQWKQIFDKVSEYCIWSIIEGGEPTSRPDFMELVRYLYSLRMPITLITNCSLLHTINLDELKGYIQFITCSIDSVFEESYCKVRGVTPQTYQRVMQNLQLLTEHKVPHYFNSVITKFNTQEFIDKSYFKRAKELGVNAVSLTFVEDRSDVDYSLLPDRDTIVKVCESVLEHIHSKEDPQVMIPPQYFEQIIKHGRGVYDECGVWKSIFVNGNGTVMVPCWKYNSPENTYNLLEKSVDEIWSAPQWEIAKTCHDCEVLGCIWYSSQPVTTFAQNYMRGLSKMISQRSPEIAQQI
ncbi:MAG TPA: radical SAM protein [Candidatus Nitrosotalea sp.]|nr:radical SAM protein [Nitrososphaerota archaeon]HKU33542.1 radical SAM protein [Candidatus Nitrosotalea sp.]